MPSRVLSVLLSVVLACLFLLPAEACSAELQRFVFEKAEMGLPFRITLYSASEESAKAASDAAFQRVRELNQIFSDYEEDSELSRLSRSSGSGEKVKVSEPLWIVLERAQTLARESGGAFDVTCGPLTSVWRRARRKFELPSPDLVAEMRERCGWQHLHLDPATRSVELRKPQMRLDLGSLAKGYTVDDALRVLKGAGHSRALVAGGGDMAAGDPPPGRTGWRIQVAALDAEGSAAPLASPVVELRNSAIATSGDRFQRLEINGRRYSHILDMRTGQPMTDHSLVTVVAGDCFIASLSTVFCVLGPAEGKRLAEKWNVAARWQRKPGDAVEIIETENWKRTLAADATSTE